MSSQINKVNCFLLFLLPGLLLCYCNTVQQVTDRLPIPGVIDKVDVSSLLKAPDPITTSFADTHEDKSLPQQFGNNKKPASFSSQPRSASGGYLLAPGYYEMTCKSYCLHAGTHGPSSGDGYLFAPLKGTRKNIIQAIVRNAASKSAIQQTTVQMLIWAVLAKTSFKNLSSDLKMASVQLLNPQQLLELNGGALGLIPQAALNKATANLPPVAREAMEAENRLRQLFQSTSTAYEDFERIAVLGGKASGNVYPSGVWSKSPKGYYVRYFPSSYKMTRVQVYVPAVMATGYTRDRLSASFASFSYDNKVEYDGTADVAVPANTGSQRLLQSNEDISKKPKTTPTSQLDNKPNFDPCIFPKEALKDVKESDAEFEAHRRLPEDQRKQKAQDAQQIQDAVRALGIKPNNYGFETMDEAGMAAIRYINGTSIAENREYAGQIYKNPSDGKYYFSSPVGGSQGISDPKKSPVPKGMEVVGDYHTHGGDFKYSDEVFSEPEVVGGEFTLGDKGSALKQHDGHAHYLGTPQGRIERLMVPKEYSDKNIVPCGDMTKVLF